VYGVTVVQKKLKQFTYNSAEKVLYVKKSTNINATYGELGRVPMFI